MAEQHLVFCHILTAENTTAPQHCESIRTCQIWSTLSPEVFPPRAPEVHPHNTLWQSAMQQSTEAHKKAGPMQAPHTPTLGPATTAQLAHGREHLLAK